MEFTNEDLKNNPNQKISEIEKFAEDLKNNPNQNIKGFIRENGQEVPIEFKLTDLTLELADEIFSFTGGAFDGAMLFTNKDFIQCLNKIVRNHILVKKGNNDFVKVDGTVHNFDKPEYRKFLFRIRLQIVIRETVLFLGGLS